MIYFVACRFEDLILVSQLIFCSSEVAAHDICAYFSKYVIFVHTICPGKHIHLCSQNAVFHNVLYKFT